MAASADRVSSAPAKLCSLISTGHDDKIITTDLVAFLRGHLSTASIEDFVVFQNRVASLTNSIRQSSTQVPNVCCAPFSSVPVVLVAASPLLSTVQQDLYQAAFDAARQQLARRSVLQTWNWRNN